MYAQYNAFITICLIFAIGLILQPYIEKWVKNWTTSRKA